MDRTNRLARRNAKKESPRAARLAKFRGMREQSVRDHIFSKHHRDSYIYYVYKSLNIILGYTLASPKWSNDLDFPKETIFKHNGEDWWITRHGFMAKDDGLVKGWIDEQGKVKWIKMIPVKNKYFSWV